MATGQKARAHVSRDRSTMVDVAAVASNKINVPKAKVCSPPPSPPCAAPRTLKHRRPLVFDFFSSVSIALEFRCRGLGFRV
jgi:hypothetical protein